MSIIVIFLLLSLVSLNCQHCDYIELNGTDCVATYTIYSGTYGNCGTDVIETTNITLEECITAESGKSSSFFECVNGYYVRHKMFNTSDCTGDYVNVYDGLDDDDCYDISCEALSCGCAEPYPCQYKCTDRSDATCTFGMNKHLSFYNEHNYNQTLTTTDCCTGIWTDPDGTEICQSNGCMLQIFYAVLIVMIAILR